MDQGITKSRLLYSGKKHFIKLVGLVIAMMMILGAWNIYMQMRAIRSDRQLVQEMQSSTESSGHSASESRETDTDRFESPEKQRAKRELDWANLQVQYYDSRVQALIRTNQEIADYLQHSLLNKGDVRNMPCYQIRFSLRRLMNPSLEGMQQGLYGTLFNSVNEMYQSETFYKEAKIALKDDSLSEVYIDELIYVNYDPLSGLVSVKAYHPEPQMADKLCRIAFDSIHTTLRAIGVNEEEMHRLDEGPRRESMNSVTTRQRDLLRDMKDNQNELVLLQGQEPPKAQEQRADQQSLPTVRAFNLRSLVLYLILGLILGSALSVLVVVLDAILNRNVLFTEDYREDGISAIVGWGKTKRGSDLLLFSQAQDVANFLQNYFTDADPSQVLLLSNDSLAEQSAFAPFAKSVYPTDGSMILPDSWKEARHVVLFAPENRLYRKVYEPLKASLLLAHQRIDAVVVTHTKTK